jgi:hypothetical protein
MVAIDGVENGELQEHELKGLVNDKLAPFQENNMGDCPEDYLEFRNFEEEYLPEYENDTREMLVGPDGSYYSTYGDKAGELKDEYIETLDEVISHRFEPYHRKKFKEFIEHKGYSYQEIPYNELFETFEEYMQEYHGFNEKDEDMDAYGYWYNPNAMWDWYQIGGRWQGMLLVEEGKGIKGETSFMNDEEESPLPGFEYVDMAQVKNIRFNKMYELSYERLADKYDEAFEEFPVTIDYNTNEVLEKYKEKEGEDAPLVSNDMKDDERKKKLKEWAKTQDDIEKVDVKAGMRSLIYGIKPGTTKEQHQETAALFTTYSVLTKDGEWVSKGDMGWFGMSANESEDWTEAYHENFINQLNGEDYVVIVDCHI